MVECWPSRNTPFMRTGMCVELWSGQGGGNKTGILSVKTACFDIEAVIEIEGVKVGPKRSHVALQNLRVERSKSRTPSGSFDSTMCGGSSSDFELALVFEKPGQFTLPILDISRIRCKYITQGKASIEGKGSLVLLTTASHNDLERLLNFIKDVKAGRTPGESKFCSVCKEKGPVEKSKIKMKREEQPPTDSVPTSKLDGDCQATKKQKKVLECIFRKKHLSNFSNTGDEQVYYQLKDLRNRESEYGGHKLKRMGLLPPEGSQARPIEIREEVYVGGAKNAKLAEGMKNSNVYGHSPVQYFHQAREGHEGKPTPASRVIFIDDRKTRSSADGARREKHRFVSERRGRDTAGVSLRLSEEKENFDVRVDEVRKVSEETVKRRLDEEQRKLLEEHRRMLDDERRRTEERRMVDEEEGRRAEKKERILQEERRRIEEVKKFVEEDKKRQLEWELKREEERKREEEEKNALEVRKKAEEERKRLLERRLQEEERRLKEERKKEDDKRAEEERLKILIQEEERQREEMRREEERRNREEEEKRIREAERKLQEQRRKQEEESKKQEQVQEQRRKVEEERKRQEQVQEQRRKLEEERKRQEQVQEQRRKHEEERKKEEQVQEQKRKQEQRKKEALLLRMKQEEDLRKRRAEHQQFLEGVRNAILAQDQERRRKLEEITKSPEEELQDPGRTGKWEEALRLHEEAAKIRALEEERNKQVEMKSKIQDEQRKKCLEIRRKALEEQRLKQEERRLEEEIKKWQEEENCRRAKDDRCKMSEQERSRFEAQPKKAEEVMKMTRDIARKRMEESVKEREEEKRKQAEADEEKRSLDPDLKKLVDEVNDMASLEEILNKLKERCRIMNEKESSQRNSPSPQETLELSTLIMRLEEKIKSLKEMADRERREEIRMSTKETLAKQKLKLEELKKREQEQKKAEKMADAKKKKIAQEQMKAARMEAKSAEKLANEAMKRAKAKERAEQQQKARQQAKQAAANAPTRGTRPPVTHKIHILTYQQYEDSWNIMKMSRKGSTLGFSDIPWPPHGNPLFIEAGDSADAQRRKLRAALLRWHPDKFIAVCGDRLSSLERETIEGHAKSLAQEVIQWKSKLSIVS